MGQKIHYRIFPEPPRQKKDTESLQYLPLEKRSLSWWFTCTWNIAYLSLRNV